jgi:hypothetical protein
MLEVKDLNIEICSVNYQTPEYIERLVSSVRKVNKNIDIRIIDGSTPKFVEENCYLNDIKDKYNFKLERMGYNIHHGPGMDYCLNNTDKEWIMFLDSDAEVLNYPYHLEIEGYFIGGREIVDANGINRSVGYLYCHPRFLIVNVEKYKEFRPFKKHGAPCIDTWIDVNKTDLNLFQFYDVNNYFTSKGRGTVNKYGYNL